MPGLLAAFVLASGLPVVAQSAPVVARATSVTGRVLLASAAGTPPFALSSGFLLNPGDRVDTRGGGKLVIELSDGSLVIVQPETVLVLKDYRAAESLRELFQITIGIVRVKINHFTGRPNPYRMNSPTASIAVRGTEFNVLVGAEGETRVEVMEGAVEVASLDNPSRSALVETGSAVLVRAGRDLLRYIPVARGEQPLRRGSGGFDRDARASRSDTPAAAAPLPGTQIVREPANRTEPSSGLSPTSRPPKAAQWAGAEPKPASLDDNSPRSTASTYERYLSSLTELGQIPFINRYNAFPEMFLDSFENPAYATEFRRAEGRLFLLPTWSGARQLDPYSNGFGSGGNRPADSSLSPQVSLFTPFAGGRFVAGANGTASHINSSDPAGTSSGTFSSLSGIFAARFGATSAGFSMERLRGSGSLTTGFDAPTSAEQYDSASRVVQTRFTAGFARDLSPRRKLGVFYRYGLVNASDVDGRHFVFGQPVAGNATRSSGHSSEVGVRLRGIATPKLFYGLSGSWLGLSLGNQLDRLLIDSSERDRLRRGTVSGGIGYLLNRQTILTGDFSAGILRRNSARAEVTSLQLVEDSWSSNRTVSAHIAIQRDLTRRFFATASFLNIWSSSVLRARFFPDSLGRTIQISGSFFPLAGTIAGNRFSDFGAGWRVRPNLTAQYVYSTSYGATSASHAVLLRYNFRLGPE